jgi:DNA mismatch endonuclease (patch repair protein)
MTDKVTPEVRSRIMASIKGKDTKPEMVIRRALHALGFRYRLHVKDLPGCPDIVLPKYNAVIMVNGCFWHGHDCHISNRPKSRSEYWEKKIAKNRDRDNKDRKQLYELGWRVATIWECAIIGKGNYSKDDIANLLSAWLKNNPPEFVFELLGRESYSVL